MKNCGHPRKYTQLYSVVGTYIQALIICFASAYESKARQQQKRRRVKMKVKRTQRWMTTATKNKF